MMGRPGNGRGVIKPLRGSANLSGRFYPGLVARGYSYSIPPGLSERYLESVGIMVDPANKTLKRLPAIPLK